MAAPSIPNLNSSRGAAPSIPNLNSLRGRTPLRRGRGRPGPVDPDALVEDPQVARDDIIRQTDSDASTSRLSAVALGYLGDEFARSFVQGQIPRRYPLINRGTYVRTTALDRLVDAFLDSATTPADVRPVAQIVSLGAGSDTRFFRRARKGLLYHELDFPSNTSAKIAQIQQSSQLKSVLLSTLSSPDDLHVSDDKATLLSSTYNIHSIDLRTLSVDVSAPPQIPNLRTDLPTLLLSECCLCYVPPAITSQILKYFTAVLTGPLSLILYEPVRPYDSFGKTMISNLGSRGIELQTLKRYYSLEAQRLRLKQAGFTAGQGARDVETIYYGDEWLEPEERERVERLEWLDEVEEWKLLARHYCIAWGWRDSPENDVFSRAWKDVGGHRTESEAVDDEAM